MNYPKLSPRRKRFYLEQMGITGRRVPVWPRVKHYASEAAFFVCTNGVAGLARKVGGKQVARARAKESAKGQGRLEHPKYWLRDALGEL